MKYILSLLSLCGTICAQDIPPPQSKEKIVLIHGIINHSSMSTFRRLLNSNDCDVIDFRYPSRDRTIEEHAATLVQKLKDTTEEDRPFSFVAFSLGGLVLKAALNHKDCPKEAMKGKIVIISSPLNGSQAATHVAKLKIGQKILGNHAGRQLAETPKDGFDYLGTFPKDVPLLVISGVSGKTPFFSEKNDWIVSTDESCPKCPHEHTYVKSNHRFICRNLETINKTIDFLQDNHTFCACTIKNM